MSKQVIALSLFALLMIGCGPGPPATQSQSGNASRPAATTAPATPQPSPSVSAERTSTITLPMLDALFQDAEFVEAVKKDQNITDAEIEQIRNAARNAVSNLSEGGNDETRSTASASNDALAKLKSVLGEQRSTQFVAFVGRHQAGGSEMVASKANQVPTDTRVVVNIPAYRMDVFKDGQLLKTYRIGIGYPEFPIPTGVRTAKAIIFNPTWTPPDEPWVKGELKPFKTVEAGSKLNPLGPIKIPIGSPSLIHGGKSAARLGGFNSHGCVGLTNGQVQDFASVLSSLSGNDISLAEVKRYQLAKTETEQVPLKQPVPVELRYETIVVENGTLKLFRDVYEKGMNTEQNLRRVLDQYGVSFDTFDAATKAKVLEALSQMSRDAAGKPIEPNANSNSTAGTNSNSTSSRVTANVKGKKEIAFPLKELAGKGYPAAKNLKAS